VSTAEVVSVVVAAIWLLVTIAQLGDIVACAVDRRSEHRPAPRGSARMLVWVLPAAFALSVPVGLGLAAGGVMAARGAVALGAIAALAMAAVAIMAVWLAVNGLTSQRSTRLIGLLDDLRAIRGRRMTPEAIAALRGRFADVASSSTRSPTPGARPSRRWRLLPIVVGMAAVLAIAIAAVDSDTTAAIGASIALPVVNGGLAFAGVRLAGAAAAARATADARHRTEIARLLDELDRGSRRGVAGLGDRVARALEILRDQQPDGR